METYPYPTSEGIIDLVRKTEFDRLKWELEEQRAELAKWQALAGQLAEALDDCNTKLVGWHGLYPSQVRADDESAFQSADKALAAYESAIATTGTQGTAQ